MRTAIICSLVAAILAAGYLLMYYEKSRRDGQKLESSDKQFDDEFAKRVSEIAKEYQSYELVKPDLNLAPTLSRAENPTVRILASESSDEETHGEKLFYLFAKDRKSYKRAATTPSFVGQVIVLESWTSVPLTLNDHIARSKHPNGQWVQSSTSRDGQAYRAGKQLDLFVMYKMDRETPDTDNGWVYGVVSPDGSKVSAAGRLTSCMFCHDDAGVDRLFGAPID